FRANQALDREWVRRTATLMFLRHRNVQVLALGSDSWLDPSYADKGHSEAQVALTGAQGLLPERAGHYRVRLEWWLEDGDWLLARMARECLAHRPASAPVSRRAEFIRPGAPRLAYRTNGMKRLLPCM